MARLIQTGFEVNSLSTLAASLNMERFQPGGGANEAAATIQSSVVRSGSFAAQCDSLTSTNQSSYVLNGAATSSASTTYYARCCFCFRDLPVPSGGAPIIFWSSTIQVYFDQATSQLQLWYGSPAAQIGSNSAKTIVADSSTWYRVELKVALDGSSNVTALELRLDGDTVASASGLSGIGGGFSSGIGPTFGMGAGGGSGGGTPCGANKRLYLDDLAMNDSTGNDQNSWPGEGKMVLLLPVSDNARAGFTGGAGATTSLFEAVNNTPPVGVADTGTDTSQIRDPTSSATDNYDANMQSYQSAGLPANVSINVMQWLISHGTASATSVPARAGFLVSNPAESAETTLTSPGSAAGTWPATWVSGRGPFIYNPSVTLGTSPVLRIGKRTASTRVVDCCFMGIYVDYTVQTTPSFPPVHLPFMR